MNVNKEVINKGHIINNVKAQGTCFIKQINLETPHTPFI